MPQAGQPIIHRQGYSRDSGQWTTGRDGLLEVRQGMLGHERARTRQESGVLPGSEEDVRHSNGSLLVGDHRARDDLLLEDLVSKVEISMPIARLS